MSAGRSKYNIDFGELVRKRLPVRQRTPRHRAWVVVLLLGLQWVYDQFRYYINERLYFLGHSSQVCRMEGVLNDTYDPTLRRIYITEGGYGYSVWLWLEWEPLAPMWLYEAAEVAGGSPAVWLYTDAEVGPSSADFVVNIPLVVFWETHRLHSLVNRYRLASKGNWVAVDF